ncbi:MAG TPA: hemolysin III family protein [Candidatus Sulfotelmatobacter sp.]|nr:hemolysin III family protein [Candidatus Sulfotelmatobacter sp.]
MPQAATPRLPAEELANSLTHGVGLVLSIVGFATLVSLAVMRGSAWRIVSCAIYGSSLLCLYAASTLYHSTRSRRLKRVLKVCDHCAIYLLIAGTYTPFLLVNLRGGWGWCLFAVVWGLAMAGILFKVWFVEHSSVLSTAVYLLMGWLALVAAKPMLIRVPPSGLLWLLAGGVLYTVGVVFYAWKRVPYGHAIWHCFVLVGSTCHYFAVLCSVISPAKALWTFS